MSRDSVGKQTPKGLKGQPHAKKAPHNVSLTKEKPIPTMYGPIDNDLARDNLENDLSAADLQDL